LQSCLTHIRSLRRIFGRFSVLVLDPHIRNVLPLCIRPVGDRVANIHVPVNARGYASIGISTTGLNEQSQLARGVLLVAPIVIDHLQLSAPELLGPVTLLASLRRGTQVRYRRLNRTRECTQSSLKYLARTRELRPYIPPSAAADVTVDATYTRMRRRL